MAADGTELNAPLNEYMAVFAHIIGRLALNACVYMIKTIADT